MPRADKKTEMVEFRAAPWEQDLFREAARVADTSVSELVRGGARREARRILAADHDDEKGEQR